MTVSLTSNFLTQARGLTFEDTGSVTWAINKNTNQISAVTIAHGTLSSVGLADASISPIYTITGSPLTANGTLDFTLIAQAKNLVFAGPATGANAQPTFRALVAADIPTLAYVTSLGSSSLSIGGTAAVPTVNLSSTQITNIGLGGSALQSATTTDSIQGAGTAGSPIELVGDSATPGNSKYYGTNVSGTRGWYASTAVPASANPSATIGLSVVNGSTGNWMDAGSAPALSVSIAPTWTGLHIFAAASNNQLTVGTTSGSGSAGSLVVINGASTTRNALVVNVSGADDVEIVGNFSGLTDGLSVPTGIVAIATLINPLDIYVSGGTHAARFATGGTTHYGPISCNGNTPPAQSTGWGTPTGGAVVASFAAGATPSLLQMSEAVAQIITVLKAVGILGA